MTSSSWNRQGLRPWNYEVVTHGFRYQFSNINAAIRLRQLARLEVSQARKQEIVRRYQDAFRDLAGVKLLQHSDEGFPFLYVIRVLEERRDSLMAYLKDQGVGANVHYIPNHLQPLFADCRQPLPVTEQLFPEILSLPLFWEMTDAEVGPVIPGVRSFFTEKAG